MFVPPMPLRGVLTTNPDPAVMDDYAAVRTDSEFALKPYHGEEIGKGIISKSQEPRPKSQKPRAKS
jgi:hypothetical protein